MEMHVDKHMRMRMHRACTAHLHAQHMRMHVHSTCAHAHAHAGGGATGAKRGRGADCACSLRTCSTTLQVTLRHREWELFTFAPVRACRHVRWAALGLADMLNGGGAILSESLRISADNDADAGGAISASVVTRGPGRFVCYSQPAPAAVLAEGEPLQFQYIPSTGQLTFELGGADDGPTNVAISWQG